MCEALLASHVPLPITDGTNTVGAGVQVFIQTMHVTSVITGKAPLNHRALPRGEQGLSRHEMELRLTVAGQMQKEDSSHVVHACLCSHLPFAKIREES